MEFNIKSCNNCPFKVVDYDGNCIGKDTILKCNLMDYLGFKSNILIIYDSIDYMKEPKLDMPKDCPVKNINIKISSYD